MLAPFLEAAARDQGGQEEVHTRLARLYLERIAAAADAAGGSLRRACQRSRGARRARRRRREGVVAAAGGGPVAVRQQRGAGGSASFLQRHIPCGAPRIPHPLFPPPPSEPSAPAVTTT